MIKTYLKYYFLFSIAFSQAEFQICSISENAFMLSDNNGFSALKIDDNKNGDVNMDVIYFPSKINYLNMRYKKYSLSILDYGRIVDQIDDNMINSFGSYELSIKYHYQKKINTQFTMDMTGGVIYSQISNYNSSAIVSDFIFYLNNESNLTFSLNNLGIIIDSYTSIHQKMPIQIQLGVIKNLNKTNMTFGYDILYHTNIKEYEHILCMQIPIIEKINFRLSTSNFRDALLTGNLEQDWFYGFGYGLSIYSDNIFTDIGISSLGSSGLIYGFSIKYITN
tara:strand:+ start:61 stop:897 length:837 start_codon:yes stop_codon:yes gene_type:complete